MSNDKVDAALGGHRCALCGWVPPVTDPWAASLALVGHMESRHPDDDPRNLLLG